MKLAIVIGHNSRAQGAERVTDGRSEYDWNGELAGLIQGHNPGSIRVFRREAGGGYSREIDRVYAQVDAWGATCSIELHFNASGSPAASGCLMLSSGSQASLGLATALQAQTVRVLGNRDRGVKVVGRQDRGGRSLWQGKAPAVLTEPYFGSNAHECQIAQQHMDELAEATYRAAWQFHQELAA